MGVAIVTGGSRGIGAAISEKLAKDGYDVVINCASSVEKAEGVAEKCRAHGVKAVVKQWDVADYAACEAAVKQIKEELGVPAVLVNNAGITRDGLLVRMKPDQFDAVVSTNLKGTFNMTQIVGAMMLRAKAGSIVSLSSVVGISGNAGQVFKKRHRFIHRHIQHFINVLALVLYFQRFTVVALTLAHFAGNIDIGQKVHFNLHRRGR